MRRSTLSLGTLVAIAALSAWACGGEGNGTSTGGGNASTSSSSGLSSSSGGGAGGDGGSIFTGHGPVVSMIVDPPMATIDVQNGVAMPVAFQAIATYQDGAKEPISASWSFDRPDLALIGTSTGALAASGKLGGKGKVTATVNGLTGTADVTIKLHVVDNSGGLTPADIAAFDMPAPEASDTLLYTYDNTVLRRRVLPHKNMFAGRDGSRSVCVLLSIEHEYNY